MRQPMPQSHFSPAERERLATLESLRVLDTPAEPVFDELVRAAARVARRPISLMSLIDASRQWFKANVGLDGVTETPREYAFCQYVVQSRQVLEVPDALKDARFAENPLVTGGPKIRAYTGVPILLDDGTALGALCVIDAEPGRLSEEQVDILRHLGRAAGLAIAQRAELIRQREAAEAEAVHARSLEKELRQDITARRLATSALEASERRFRKLFQYSLGLICTHDLDGIVLAVNPAAASSLGYSMGEMMGRSLADFMRPERRASLASYLGRIEERRIDAGMLELVAHDGSLRYWRYQNVLDTDADEPYVLGHAQDVTEQQYYEKTLLDWSTKDALTHAMNRRYLADFEAVQTEDSRWACIAIDIDHFKQVNDTFGHQRGDELLVAVADLLRDASGSDDVVVRMGGDEFIVVVRDPERLEQVMLEIGRRQAGAGVSLSLGASRRRPGASVDETIAEADQELYARRIHTRGHSRH